MGENLDKIAKTILPKDLMLYSPYILSLATHPLLDTDELSRDSSLMFADQSLFNFSLASKNINFSLFQEACGTIAEYFTGFPTVPKKKKITTAQLPKREDTPEKVVPTSDTPQPPAVPTPAPIVPTPTGTPGQSTQKPPIASVITAPTPGTPPAPVTSSSSVPDEPTGWISWFFSPVVQLWRWFTSFLWFL